MPGLSSTVSCPAHPHPRRLPRACGPITPATFALSDRLPGRGGCGPIGPTRSHSPGSSSPASPRGAAPVTPGKGPAALCTPAASPPTIPLCRYTLSPRSCLLPVALRARQRGPALTIPPLLRPREALRASCGHVPQLLPGGGCHRLSPEVTENPGPPGR